MSSPNEASAGKSSLQQRSANAQFIEFELDQRRYAFRIEQIREIVILKEFTPVPQVVEFVDGVSNLRGSIIPIINLRPLFGLPRIETNDETRTIVLKVGSRTIGCTVDTVTQVLKIAKDQIQAAPETIVADGGTYIEGFAKVDDRLVIILDVERLLNVEQLRQIKPAQIPGL